MKFEKGDILAFKNATEVDAPPFVLESNEVVYIGEFLNDKDEPIAICSHPLFHELLYINTSVLVKKKTQPDQFTKLVNIQLDVLSTLKELSAQLNSFADMITIHRDHLEEMGDEHDEEDKKNNFH